MNAKWLSEDIDVMTESDRKHLSVGLTRSFGRIKQ